MLDKNFRKLSALLEKENAPPSSSKKKKKKDPREPKKPPSAYDLFFQAEMEAAKEELGMDAKMSEVMILMAKRWRELSEKQKEVDFQED